MNCAITLRRKRCKSDIDKWAQNGLCGGKGEVEGKEQKRERDIKLKANLCSLMTFVTDLPSMSYRGAANDDDDNGASCLPLCKKATEKKNGRKGNSLKIKMDKKKKYKGRNFHLGEVFSA